mmetsp:Transcript_11582/g.18845  ORF Transcript_11582/g.18845 Transcript_11582/m.18845 type:complete len:82 (+) Transcript_11582:358-603(+)
MIIAQFCFIASIMLTLFIDSDLVFDFVMTQQKAFDICKKTLQLGIQGHFQQRSNYGSYVSKTKKTAQYRCTLLFFRFRTSA